MILSSLNCCPELPAAFPAELASYGMRSMHKLQGNCYIVSETGYILEPSESQRAVRGLTMGAIMRMFQQTWSGY